jgi:enamine deaminase RidA (YjgF/YER057c/UK114 family)
VTRFDEDGVTITMEVMAALGPDGRRLPRRHSWPEGHWDWPTHLPYKHGGRCADAAFVGGQVALTPAAEVIAPDDLERQLAISVDNIGAVLAGLDLGLGDLARLHAYCAGDADADELGRLLGAELARHGATPPPLTAVQLPYLAYQHMVVEIAAVATARPAPEEER